MEVDWQPGLSERPANGTWVIALQNDGCLVEQGMTGYVVGSTAATTTTPSQPIIRWANNTQSRYPTQHLQRINKPNVRGYLMAHPTICWRPASIDNTPDGVPPHWLWMRTAGEAA